MSTITQCLKVLAITATVGITAGYLTVKGYNSWLKKKLNNRCLIIKHDMEHLLPKNVVDICTDYGPNYSEDFSNLSRYFIKFIVSEKNKILLSEVANFTYNHAPILHYKLEYVIESLNESNIIVSNDFSNGHLTVTDYKDRISEIFSLANFKSIDHDLIIQIKDGFLLVPYQSKGLEKVRFRLLCKDADINKILIIDINLTGYDHSSESSRIHLAHEFINYVSK